MKNRGEERCTRCGDATGRAGIGEDSLCVNRDGAIIVPLCSDCFDVLSQDEADAELGRLVRQLPTSWYLQRTTCGKYWSVEQVSDDFQDITTLSTCDTPEEALRQALATVADGKGDSQ
jgi:hypothetical protein